MTARTWGSNRISVLDVNSRSRERPGIILCTFSSGPASIPFAKYDGPYLSLSSPGTARRGRPEEENSFNEGAVSAVARRGGQRKRREERREKKREKAGRTCFSRRISRGEEENGTNTACFVPRRWRGTKQCCIVALDGLLTQVSECTRSTRDTCASRPSGSSSISRSAVPLPLSSSPKSAGDLAYRSPRAAWRVSGVVATSRACS